MGLTQGLLVVEINHRYTHDTYISLVQHNNKEELLKEAFIHKNSPFMAPPIMYYGGNDGC